jgi:mRNA deadenylase 3'-5' endonuclease subunit Ccr4
LEWSYRERIIISQLLKDPAEIICLHEIEPNFFDVLDRLLADHSGHYLQKYGSGADGSAIFVNRNRFKVVGTEYLEYGRVHDHLRANVAIIATLKCFDSGKKLIIGTSHILFNPKRGDIKLEQLGLLFESIENMLHNHSENSPVIITGDFNLIPNSFLYDYILGGRISAKLSNNRMCGTNPNQLWRPPTVDSEYFTHSLRIKDIFDTRELEEKNMISSIVGREKKIVDFMFYGNHKNSTAPNRLILDSVLSLPKLSDVGAIPDEKYPSDHFHLLAKFHFD